METGTVSLDRTGLYGERAESTLELTPWNLSTGSLQARARAGAEALAIDGAVAEQAGHGGVDG